MSPPELPNDSLKHRVLRLSISQDGDILVCGFPKREEIVIRGLRLRDVAGWRVGSAYLQVCQGPIGSLTTMTRLSMTFLKFDRRFYTLVRRKISETPYIDRIKQTEVGWGIAGRRTQIIGHAGLQKLDCLQDKADSVIKPCKAPRGA